MKEIKLKKIKLSNWRGQNHEVSFNDTKTIIKGRNRIGKSSIMEGFFWCLSGYTNPNYPKNYNLFNNEEELTKDTPTASVTVWLNINGLDYVLERQTTPNFTRKRGSNEYEKGLSDKFVYLIDNIEVGISNFNNWVKNNICDIDKLTFALNGNFFAVLCEEDKNSARKVLESIVGIITDNDMKGEYTELRKKLEHYTIEQVKEQTKNSIKPLQKRLEEIPALIERYTELLSEYEINDFNAIESDINSTKEEIKKIDESMLDIAKAFEPVAKQRDEIIKKINEKVYAYNNAKIDYENAYKREKNSIKEEIADLDRINDRIRRENEQNEVIYNQAQKSLKTAENTLKIYIEKRNELLEERDAVKTAVYDDTQAICPLCHQALPENEIEKAKAEFEQKKIIHLKEIVSKGLACKNDIEALNHRISECNKTINAGIEKKPLIDGQELQNKLQALENAFIPYEKTTEAVAKQNEIDNLKNMLPDISHEDNGELLQYKETLIDKLEQLNRQYGLKFKAESIREGITSLNNEKSEIGAKIAELEGILVQVDNYVQERANITSDRINSKLSNIRIEMYNRLKNGNLTPDCVILNKDGVKYATVNNSDKIKMQIELQQLFCKHFDIQLPCWIDEAAIFDSSNIPTLDYQYILLYASDDNILTID